MPMYLFNIFNEFKDSYHYSPVVLQNRNIKTPNNFFWKVDISNLIVSENKALLFNFSKKKFRIKLYFHDQKGLKFFCSKLANCSYFR